MQKHPGDKQIQIPVQWFLGQKNWNKTSGNTTVTSQWYRDRNYSYTKGDN